MHGRIMFLSTCLICSAPGLRAQALNAGPNGLGDGQVRVRTLPGAPHADANSSTLEMARLPTTIVPGDSGTSQVVVTFAATANQTPTLAAAPLTPATLQTLGQLRLTLAGIYNRLGSETSTRSYEGLPHIEANTGVSRTTVVRVSSRDRENARHQAETTAGLALERFQRETMPIKAAPAGNGEYRFAALPPGDYVFCALCRIKDADATTATTTKRGVWWTTFRVGTHNKVSIALAPGNAIDWTGVFRFP